MNTQDRINRLSDEMDDLRDAKEGYFHAGKPRYDRLFGRDSLISAWQRLEKEPTVALGTLRILGRMQGKKHDRISEEQPGRILHEWAPEPVEWVPWRFPYYGASDATQLFICMAVWLWRRLEDDRVIDEFWPNVKAGCEWMEYVIDHDKNSLLSYESTNPKGLKDQGWKDGWSLGPTVPTAIIEIQGYTYTAFLHAAAWADHKDTKLAQRWRERAQSLKQSVDERFWMENERCYALAIEGDGSQYPSVTSNVGHLLFTGIMDKSRSDVVVKRLFESDMWTNFGMRTLSKNDDRFDLVAYHKGCVWPHDNWIVAEGLRVAGYAEERQKIINALEGVDEIFGKIPELYTVTKAGKLKEIEYAQYPQAWSSGALLNLLDSSLNPETAIRILPPSV